MFKNACSHSAMNLPLGNVKYVHYVNVYDFSLLTTACGMCECMTMYVAHIDYVFKFLKMTLAPYSS